MFNTLKFKIAATALLLISIIMIAVTWRDIYDTEQKLLNNQKEKTILLSDRITHGIMVLMLNNRWKDLQAMMVSLAQDSKDLKEIRILNPDDGSIIVSSEAEEVGEQIYENDREKLDKRDFEAFILDKGLDQYASKLTPIKNQAACYKCHGSEKDILGVLDIEISLAGVRKSIEKLKKDHLLDSLIAFSLITGAFLLVVGILIDRPITKMIRTIRKIESGDLTTRMDVNKKDEFGLLARSFNDMLSSLHSAKKEIEHCHLEQMQKASRLASLGEIISGIAHEIKNPLTGISCAVQILQSDLRNHNSDTVLKNQDKSMDTITEIHNQIQRLDKILKDLLSFARPKPPRFFHAKINEVIEKALFFVYPEAQKQKIAIETDIEMDFPEMKMDPDQMQQVFLNLMINALQATPEGGTLTVSVSQKTCKEIKHTLKKPLACDTLLECEKLLEIQFHDSGKGIPPEDIESIFEPFFTKKSKGTGLGLFISQKIIQEHGGEITVESRVGKGSTFTVYLPMAYV
jgi:signal transduction histidine kinase